MSLIFGTALLMTALATPDAQEISFQTFKTDLLANKMVDRIEVVNKSLVKVYVRRQYASSPKDSTSEGILILLRVILCLC